MAATSNTGPSGPRETRSWSMTVLPMTIRATADGGGLLFQRTPTGAAFDLLMLPAARPLQVDADALQVLLADLRWTVELTADSVALAEPHA